MSGANAFAALLAQLARMDDDAWEAVANRGLLRRARKDLAGGLEVEITSEDGPVVARVGEFEVSFPASGPSRATCSCPSVSICQHVVAAGIALAASPEATVTEHLDASPSPGEGHEATVTDRLSASPSPPNTTRPAAGLTDDELHSQVMGFTDAELRAHAGLPGLRWAHQWLADHADAARVDRTKGPSVSLSHPDVTFRYLGGGLDALLVDASLPQPKRWDVVAVLAYQRAHGLVLTAPAAPSSRGPTARDLTIDHSRAELRASAERLVLDCVRVGLSRLSPAMHERFATLATWAQGASYPRLARMLRRLADHVELLLHRSGLADEHRMLAELSVTYALIRALDLAANDGEAPVHLVGRSRSNYEPVRSLDLVGLGSLPWVSQTGYHGLTSVFVRPEREGILTWTDARPTGLAGFDPIRRYREPGPWSGLRAPASTAGATVRLTDAKVSDDGRISGTERTSAMVLPMTGTEVFDVLAAPETFAEAVAAFDPRRQPLLGTATTRGSGWVVVRPARWLPAHFEEARQLLTWRLVDAAGDVLDVEVRWGPLREQLVTRIEALSTQPVPEGALLVVRVAPSGGRLVAEPLALVDPSATTRPVDVLGLPPAKDPKTPVANAPAPARSRIAELMRSRTSRKAAAAATTQAPALTAEPEAPPPPLPAAFTDLRVHLESLSERGVGGASPGAIRADLARAIDGVRRIGLTALPAEVADDPAVALLRTHFLVQQVTIALTGQGGERESTAAEPVDGDE